MMLKDQWNKGCELTLDMLLDDGTRQVMKATYSPPPRRREYSDSSSTRKSSYREQLRDQLYDLRNKRISYVYAHDLSVYQSTPFDDLIEKVDSEHSRVMFEEDMNSALGACFRIY